MIAQYALGLIRPSHDQGDSHHSRRATVGIKLIGHNAAAADSQRGSRVGEGRRQRLRELGRRDGTVCGGSDPAEPEGMAGYDQLLGDASLIA